MKIKRTLVTVEDYNNDVALFSFPVGEQAEKFIDEVGASCLFIGSNDVEITLTPAEIDEAVRTQNDRYNALAKEERDNLMDQDIFGFTKP